jgi:DNA modification methylase
MRPSRQPTDKLRSKPAQGIQAAPRIEVAYRRISELKLNPHNPRIHTGKQIRQIASSIEKFSFNVPVLIDAQDTLIAGEGRVLACQLLGWTEVPTFLLDHLSEPQARAFTIADNRLSETSQWNDELLAQQLKELSELNLDFSLETTGFDMAEIDLRIEGLKSEAEAEEDPADAPASVQVGPRVSRPSSLWLLGRHRVLCASALDGAAYKLLMQHERAAMGFSDPPYNVEIEGNVSGLGSIHHRDFMMASGEMNETEFTAFLTCACTLLARYSLPGSLHYLFMDWRHLPELLAAGREVYGELMNLCIWVKRNGGMGSFYRSRHELILIFKHGRARHRNNVQLGQFGRNRTNVWEYPSPTAFGKSDAEGNLLALHPTVKPTALVADAILDASARGDIVLDPFLGSGTTVIAAARTGRRCYGLELDPLYVDTIVRRWQAFTGEQARHGMSGKSFDELEKEAAEHDAK